MFGTWGPGDLTELQRNMKFYNLLSLIRGPIHILRCTETVRDPVRNDEEPPGASSTPPTSSISRKDEHFHQALSDAKYTADILRIDMDVVLAYDSIDVYQNPKSKREEIHAVYNGYTEIHLPRIRHKRRSMHDHEVCSTHYCICGKTARKRFTLVFGRREKLLLRSLVPGARIFEGKARMKHSDEGKLFVVRNHPASAANRRRGKSGRRREPCGRRGIRRGKEM